MPNTQWPEYNPPNTPYDSVREFAWKIWNNGDPFKAGISDAIDKLGEIMRKSTQAKEQNRRAVALQDVLLEHIERSREKDERIARLERDLAAWEIIVDGNELLRPVETSQSPLQLACARQEIEIRGLRWRVHVLEGHNQPFERCESAWCHPEGWDGPGAAPAPAVEMSKDNELLECMERCNEKDEKIKVLEFQFREVAAQSERFRQGLVAAQEQNSLVAEAKDAEIDRLAVEVESERAQKECFQQKTARLQAILADNRCWMDEDPESACRLSSEEMKASCDRFIAQLDGRPVLNAGQMTIAQLTREVERLEPIAKAAEALIEALTTCHKCGDLSLPKGPMYCVDRCSSYCGDHVCPKVEELYAGYRKASELKEEDNG